MLIELVALTALALLTPRLLPGVKVDGWPTALAVAALFAVFNVVLGWLLTFVVTVLSIPAIVLTLGLFFLVIPCVVNAILLKIVDALVNGFHLGGWGQAFGMGGVFALGGWVLRRVGEG